MILFFYVTMILSKLSSILSIIYIDHKSNIHQLPAEGPVKYSIYLKSFDLFYETYQPYQCNFENTLNNIPCSIYIAAQFCLSKLAYNGEWPVHYNDYYFGFNLAGKIEKSNPHYIEQNKEAGLCSDINTVKLPFDSSFVYYTHDAAKLLSKYMDTSFAYQASVAIHIGYFDSENDKMLALENIQFSPIRPNISFHKSIHRKIENSIMLDAPIFTEIYVKTLCREGYTGQTCWIRCMSSSKKYTCICPKKNEATSEPCTFTCKPGWLSMYSKRVIANFEYRITTCDSWDYCFHNKQYCDGICLPLTNASGICGDIKVFITSNRYSLNITSNNFLDSEIISVGLNAFYVPNINIYKHGKVEVLSNKHELRYKLEHQGNDDLIDNMYKLIVDDENLENTFNFHFKIILKHWKQDIKINKYFRIYKAPDRITIHDEDAKKNLGSYKKLIVGNKIICNSSGRPMYRVLKFLDISDIIQMSDPIDRIVLPMPASINYNAVIGCKAELIIKGRPNIRTKFNTKVTVKGLVYHYWTPDKNIVNAEDTRIAKCHSKSNLKYKQIVYEPIGYHEVLVTDHGIVFQKVMDRVYTLICSIRFKSDQGFHFITLSKQLSMKKKPDYICFNIFPNVVGSIVQCSHNGIYQDDYVISLQMMYLNKLYAFDKHYFRIPYDFMTGIDISIRCALLETRTNTTTFIYKYIELSSRTWQWYERDVNKKCNDKVVFVDHSFLPSTIYYRMVWKHYILFLDDSTDGQILLYTIRIEFYMFFGINILLIFIIIPFLFSPNKSSKKMTLRTIKRMCRINRQRALTEKIVQQVGTVELMYSVFHPQEVSTYKSNGMKMPRNQKSQRQEVAKASYEKWIKAANIIRKAYI